jgi:ABC-type sugar transport system substrate-binding protein
VDSLIAQKVDASFIPPRSEKPLARAVLKAKAAGIPVILLDRGVDTSIAKAGRDYVTFIGSDFVEEGRMAGQWLLEATDGKAEIIQLEGTVGSTPASDRRRGFEEAIAGHEGMQIIASQSADFARDKARKVMETLLQAHPNVTAVYTHGDDMAIGAIAALESAGRQPGTEVLVVGVDGSRVALELVVAGKLGATIECNPRFGPKAFDVLEDYANGESIPVKIINPDRIFDASNAAEGLKTAF